MDDALAGTDGQLMVMAAHRYCLGRQSYIVGACIAWLQCYWTRLEEHTQVVIVRDTIEALQDKRAGGKLDITAWEQFAEWVWSRLEEEQRVLCQQALAYRNKPCWLYPQGEE